MAGECWLQAQATLDSGGARALPLAIMTSDDTHSRTEELLKAHHYFGAQPTQVTLIKQEKVPSGGTQLHQDPHIDWCMFDWSID
jgi:UDP-sugar pyrophosphorylase